MTVQYICQSCGEVDCVTTIVTVCWDPSQQQWLPDSNDIALAGYRCLECDSWEVEEIIEGGSMKHYALHDGHIVEGGPISLMRAIYGRDDRYEYVLDYDKENVAKVIDEVFDTLSERESLVIKGRFGLNPGDSTPKTLEQVSRSLRAGTPFGKHGVTRERIRQIQMTALRKLRHPTRRLKLDELLVRRNTNLEE